MKKRPMNSSPRKSKDPLTQQTPTRRRVYHGDEEKPAAAKKPAVKKPKPAAATAETGKPVIPEHREDIQAPYKFTEEEIATMNHGLRNALDEIDTLKAQAKAAAQDFKLRITNKENDAKQFRNKLTAGEETRAMKAAVQFEPSRSMKIYLHPESGAFIREEPMQPADWQLPLFKTEEPEAKKPATPPPAPAGKPGKAATPSPAGKTSVGDALNKAAGETEAPQFWIDLDRPEGWKENELTAAWKKAAKAAGWKTAQISALADVLKKADGEDKMMETLRPFVIAEEERIMHIEVPEQGAIRVQRLDVALPNGFPLEKVTGTFRKAAKAAGWKDEALDTVVNEAERQARVIGDEPEATETAISHLRNYCILHV